MHKISAKSTSRRLAALIACCAGLGIVPSAAQAADQLAVGRGQIVDSAPPDGDLYTFSFKARNSSGVADGYYLLANPNRGFSQAGTVDCLRVDGGDAVLSGTITSQTGVGPGDGGVGDSFLAFITGASGSQTFFSPFVIPDSLPGLCLGASSTGGSPLVKGAIAVKG